MGILDKIFKSLWGKEEVTPTPPPKREEVRYEPPRVEPKTTRQQQPEVARVQAEPMRPQPEPARPQPEPARLQPEIITPPVDLQPQSLTQPEQYEQQQTFIEELQEVQPAAATFGEDIFQPPPQIETPREGPESGFNIFDEMVEDFDEAFDAAFNRNFPSEVLSTPASGAGEVKHDEAAIQDLFANIAANYAKPVKNFVFELKRGTATKEWIDICRPALRSISRAAESMELKAAAKKMVDFDEALSLAQASEDRVLGGDIRDLILSSYDELIEVLPQTFTIGEEEQQREGIIINSLLKQIPDLGRVTFEKLYGAGLTSLDTLFLAKKEDLAAATGIPLWLCERICNKFQEYREELEGTPRDVAQSGYRNRLIELVAELKRQHEGFERASAEEWANPALAHEKRKFRQNRQACVLQINVVLAEMGELDLVNELQKLSFDRRIQRLEEYIQSTAGMM
ncbi:MAG: hypothetical protein RMM17_05305 [Acidobacteriota bacterium]|nr:hypothetical protein [Blastocatellia bacterium]MDW8412081.1 hypothetical protein [Acidobacteriota bacterium]